jgi:hypothetical protein
MLDGPLLFVWNSRYQRPYLTAYSFPKVSDTKAVVSSALKRARKQTFAIVV